MNVFQKIAQANRTIREANKTLNKLAGFEVDIKTSFISEPLIRELVEAVTGIEWEVFSSRDTTRGVVNARYLYIYLMYNYTFSSSSEIGEFIKLDRSTVSHALTTIKGWIHVKDELFMKPLLTVKNALLNEHIS